MAKDDYDATTKVVARTIRGDKRFTVGNGSRGGPSGLSASVEDAVQVSEFVEATLTHVTETLGLRATEFEDGETVGVYGIYDRRPDDADEELARRRYEEVEVEEVET